MDTNFSYLSKKKEFALFGPACIDAENVLATSPVMSAVASRKALELCVKWIYSTDYTLGTPREDGLQALLHNNGFPSLMDYSLWKRFQYVVKNGNKSVHTSKILSKEDAILSLNILFDFVQWIEYCYGQEYTERKFNDAIIPDASAQSKKIESEYARVIKDIQRNADKIVNEKDKQIQELLELNARLSKERTEARKVHEQQRTYIYEDNMAEWKTRKRYINADLECNGYIFDQTAKRNCIETEYPVVGMPNESGTGYVDYVIWGDTGKIIALIEAKKTSVAAEQGKNQGEIYADCIQNMQGFRPIIFYTNGFETYLWDDMISAPRIVSGVFGRRDLDKMIERRYNRKPLGTIKIDEEITNRHYQLRAVTKCCENYERGDRNCLLIMATGTGKTRTAASVVDVLTRGEHITTMLFLADRKALVEQANEAFQKYIPHTTTCNLVKDRKERNARFVFSTYPTILSAIDKERNEDGSRFFSPGHFDLIVVDEAHRSIFNKYKAIFAYFDACKLGLTATPKKTVHQSTYNFFEMKNNMPTDVYEYEEAVSSDHVLVPFYLIETSTRIPEEGLNPEDMTADEQKIYEDEFTEEGETPERIPPEKINKYIFNKDTANRMISDLMNHGIRHKNGNHVGKTIVFAQTKKHAQFLIERFDALYPEYKGQFCKLVICDEPYADQNLKDFKKADSMPFIAITVDMLETGIDVPEIVNLVFAKKVYSRIKFDQMIGRGTRLCENLFGAGSHKTEFYIFDYVRNFQYFDEHPKGKETGIVLSPITEIFIKKIRIIKLLQNAEYESEEYQKFRSGLIKDVLEEICGLNPKRIEVKLKMRHIEKYKDEKRFECLTDEDKENIIEHLAGLISSCEADENAVNFDNSMYGLMLSSLEANRNFNRIKSHIQKNAGILSGECATIPEVKAKIPELQELQSEKYWNEKDILKFEETRRELRDIMKFLLSENTKIHYVDFEDEVVYRAEGREFCMSTDDFEDYRKKVNEYVETHKQHPAIKKLIYNEPITKDDYEELERIFTKELGTKEEYTNNYEDTPFGILIRKIAKMDRDSAYAAFSAFIAEERPNAEQIHFIDQIVDYVVENGYIKDVLDLMKAPFDRPFKFSIIFTRDEQMKLVHAVNAFKENALVA
ncbi:MAG: DEAD/DEAH box helicase family protein [Eubacterium sp.]|nr:DEAD/DEAH box helicase family protein [Eubacterium sp.]